MPQATVTPWTIPTRRALGPGPVATSWASDRLTTARSRGAEDPFRHTGPIHLSVVDSPLVFVSCRALRGPGTSLSGFVRTWARGRRNERWICDEVARADAESARGCDPVAVHRLLLGLLAGSTAEELRRALLIEARPHRPHVSPIRDALRRRRALGDTVVVASELPRGCVSAMASGLGALSLCADVVIDDHGGLTGDVGQPMIGAERAAAAARLAVEHAISLADCTGVGCWWGDLELLRAVGAVELVGDHPGLLRLAYEEQWPTTTWHGGAVARGRTA